MNKRATLLAAMAALFFVGTDALGMAFEPVKIILWRRGETLLGEEFLAANEGVVDYLATLKRPTEGLKGIRYECQVKGRAIQPTVQSSGGTTGGTTWSSVWLAMIYEIKDCVEAGTADAGER